MAKADDFKTAGEQVQRLAVKAQSHAPTAEAVCARDGCGHSFAAHSGHTIGVDEPEQTHCSQLDGCFAFKPREESEADAVVLCEKCSEPAIRWQYDTTGTAPTTAGSSLGRIVRAWCAAHVGPTQSNAPEADAVAAAREEECIRDGCSLAIRAPDTILCRDHYTEQTNRLAAARPEPFVMPEMDPTVDEREVDEFLDGAMGRAGGEALEAFPELYIGNGLAGGDIEWSCWACEQPKGYPHDDDCPGVALARAAARSGHEDA